MDKSANPTIAGTGEDARVTGESLELPPEKGQCARIKRWMFNLGVGMSLVMLAATLVIWWLSYRSPWSGEIKDRHAEFHLVMSSESGFLKIGETHHFEYWRVGHWKLMLLWLVLPARWWQLRRRRDQEAQRGCCPGCGYDLRATPERCPECGTMPEEIKPRMGHG